MTQLQPFKMIFALALSAATVAALAGCSMPKASDLKPSKLFSLGDDDEPEEGIPVRMVGAWTDTVHTKTGQPAQRGFGGRLMFYGNDNDKPILVEGQLVVYAFDETGRALTDNKPTRRYVFPPDQMPLHMSVSELGASYSFFLPWDEAGGPQTEVSLICRFEAKGGGVITSEQTRHRLPGTLPPGTLSDGKPPRVPDGVPYRPAQPTLENIQASRIHDPNLQLASYESAVPNTVPIAELSGAAPNQSTQMTTTSIPLPPHYRLPVGQPTAPVTPMTFNNSPAVVPQQPKLQQPQQHIGTAQQAALPAQAAVPAAVPTTLPAANALPTQPIKQPIQQTQLGFRTLPAAPQMTAPTTILPATNASQGHSYGIVPPLQNQAAAAQPVVQQPARTIPTRNITWNTVQSAQAPPLRQPSAFAPALQQPSGFQPMSANALPLPATMNPVANYPAGAAVGQAF
jgi:hypothetical protein